MLRIRHAWPGAPWRELNAPDTPITPHKRLMQFARLQCESKGIPAGLEELRAGGDLDLLQLDYQRPRAAVVEGRASAELPERAVGFPQAARALVKSLFLEPELRVVTSAGWADAFGCVERAAAVLVEGGCGGLTVSAVRGSNLLPMLEMLVADHVDLSNASTGAPWKELREPILAADLQLGAGPLVTALAENARVVIAGCYDDASPATAAAVAEFGWDWNDCDRLAMAATAARAAVWCDWRPEGEDAPKAPWMPLRIEINAAGKCILNATRGGDAAALRLQEWLKSGAQGDGESAHADVQLDLSALSSKANGRHQIAVDGAIGAKNDGRWRLDVFYQAGYAAEAMLEFAAGADPNLRRQIADVARAHLELAEDASGLLTVEPLQPLSERGGGWLHLAYQSKSRKACQYFVDQTLRLTTAHRPLVRLISGAPRAHVHCGLWPVRVPRDAVDIAVETRLAKEWV